MTTRDEQIAEVARCYRRADYFLDHYVRIYDATELTWVPFRLWPEQRRTLRTIAAEPLTIVLKARQLGLSWLVLGYALWLTLFRPAATVLLFSRRDTEAVHLLADRLRGMFRSLPEFLRYGLDSVEENDHEWVLSNGSVVRAFPTSAGDSYTATLAIVDEADLVPDLGQLMRAVKPTIDGGGRMILLSRSDKSRPNSEFKRIYRAARAGTSPWAAVFLPWYVRPARDAAWYAAQQADVLERTGSLDDLHEQYPATDTEALAPRTLDKRIAATWLQQCYAAQAPLSLTGIAGAPAIPGLVVYQFPAPGRRYVGGVDPAEGNPTSDDSAATFLDAETGEEVACLAGKLQPSTLAAHADALGRWFNGAALMVERNNHGHAVLLWLRDNSRLQRLAGFDGREGWLSNTRGKNLLYDTAADAFRDQDTLIHSFESYMQLASIEGSTLRAPEGEADDRADSYALALAGRAFGRAAQEILAHYRALATARREPTHA